MGASWWAIARAALADFVAGVLAVESSSTKTVAGGGAPARTVTVPGPVHLTTVTHVVVHTQTSMATTAAPTAPGEASGDAGHTYTGTQATPTRARAAAGWAR